MILTYILSTLQPVDDKHSEDEEHQTKTRLRRVSPEMLLLIIKLFMSLMFTVITGLAIWHGYTLTIGVRVSFEQYPLKRFFVKKP